MNHLVGIDIGSHKVSTIVGEALSHSAVRVLGVGHAPSAGIRRGEVVHLDDAAGAVAASIERAERVSGLTIRHAQVGITGTHLEGFGNQAVVPCGRRARAVEPADVARVLESATAVPLGAGREVVHVLPQRFRIDDGSPVDSPLGMEGLRLAAEVHVVSGAASVLATVRRCLELAEVHDASLTMSTLAAAEATLTADERELGVLVIDMGAASSGLAAYRDGALAHCAVLPIGGRHMTNDLAVVLQTPLAEAERIKTTYGHVLPELDADESALEIAPFGDAEPRKTTRRLVAEVLAARADELARLVGQTLGETGLAGRLPAGAVLVGGGAELSGMARRLHEHLDCPVRVGRPSGVIGLSEAGAGPAHAGAIGLLSWRARGVRDAAHLPAARANGHARAEGLVEWLRAAFLPGGGKGRQ